MCHSWAILYYEDSLALDELGLVEADIGRCLDDSRIRVCHLQVGLNNFNALWLGSVYFVDYCHVCHSNIYFSGIVRQCIPRPLRIYDYEVNVRFDEWHVVVTSVPKNDISLILSLPQD